MKEIIMKGRKRTANKKTIVNSKKIIRCKQKMIPVFENDNCESFITKSSTEHENFCKNCKHSF
jgi:hypothetical protein